VSEKLKGLRDTSSELGSAIQTPSVQ